MLALFYARESCRGSRSLCGDTTAAAAQCFGVRHHAVGSACPSAEIQLPSRALEAADCILHCLTCCCLLSEANCVLNEAVIVFACQTHHCVLTIINHHTFGSRAL